MTVIPRGKSATRVELADDADAIHEYIEQESWGDGHPVTSPTEERVERFLRYIGRDPQDVVAVVEPSKGLATVEKIAACAVMAGCKPEYLPVLIAALEIVGENRAWAYRRMMTSHSISPLMIINGPIRAALGIRCGSEGMGVSWRANATIARALRLALINIGGRPGISPTNTWGWLVHYSYCIAENEEQSPWEPYHVERGFKDTHSTVTLLWGEPPRHMEWLYPLSTQELLHAMGRRAATLAVRMAVPYPVMMFGPDHARGIAQAGFSKKDVKRFFHENARCPYGWYGPNARSGFPADWQKLYTHAPDVMVPLTSGPEDWHILVGGGSGPQSLYLAHNAGAPLIKKIEVEGR
ncbi:MAG: hypothetical protein HYX92_03435 [Chloroflexi bacterium]|nr:hypothetical protein [Chloroflexota bacterium]